MKCFPEIDLTVDQLGLSVRPIQTGLTYRHLRDQIQDIETQPLHLAIWAVVSAAQIRIEAPSLDDKERLNTQYVPQILSGARHTMGWFHAVYERCGEKPPKLTQTPKAADWLRRFGIESSTIPSENTGSSCIPRTVGHDQLWIAMNQERIEAEQRLPVFWDMTRRVFAVRAKSPRRQNFQDLPSHYARIGAACTANLIPLMLP